jgi:hypothetical protein
MNNHPITPSPELVQQWMAEFYGTVVAPGEATTDIATRAAQWGADQELEACCEWVSKYLPYLGDFPMPEDKLRAVRRPNPPSLKEQALEAQQRLMTGAWRNEDWQLISRALESL